jgi:hypothetical protein
LTEVTQKCGLSHTTAALTVSLGPQVGEADTIREIIGAN